MVFFKVFGLPRRTVSVARQKERKVCRFRLSARLVQRKEDVMFTHITNLAHVRSITEALGFFLFYVVLLIGLSTFLGHYMGTLGLIEGGKVGTFFEGGHLHTLIGTGWTLFLSSMVLSGKKLTNDLMSVIIALVGVYLSYTVDVLMGMVVVSYLTTVDVTK